MSDNPFDTSNNPAQSYCEGKRRFDSHKVALQVASRKRRGDHALHPYRCARCGDWHLGSKRGGVPKGGRAGMVRRRAKEATE